CAKMFGRSLWGCVDADDEPLLLDALELHPAAASASWLVSRTAMFANDPFEAMPLHFVEQQFRVATNRARVPNRIAAVIPTCRDYSGAQFFEKIFARLQRQ